MSNPSADDAYIKFLQAYQSIKGRDPAHDSALLGLSELAKSIGELHDKIDAAMLNVPPNQPPSQIP